MQDTILNLVSIQAFHVAKLVMRKNVKVEACLVSPSVIVGLENVYIAENIYPWVNTASGIALLTAVPISLLLSIFKLTRGIGGAGLYISSYLVGINLWVWSLMVAYSLAGLIWLLIGVLAGGIGIVPIAIIASLLKAEWTMAGQIFILLVIVFALRWFGVYLAGKAS